MVFNFNENKTFEKNFKLDYSNKSYLLMLNTENNLLIY